MQAVAFHSIHFSPLFGTCAPILDVIAETAAAGFTAIGLDRASIEGHVEAGGSVDDVATALTAAGLTCSDLVFLPLGADAVAVAQDATGLAELAMTIGTDVCVAAAMASVPWDVLVRGARAAASVLDSVGVRLALEFAPYGHVRTLRDAVAVCDAVGWDGMGLTLDSLHTFRSGTDLAAVAALDASQIALVQFSDAAGETPDDLAEESRHRRCIPGEGDLDLHAFVTAVRGTGFDGPVSAEVLSDELRRSDRVDVAARMHAAMTAYWGAG